MSEQIRVGGVQASAATLKKFATDYLSGNEEWAYPAYDSYGGAAASEIVEDADFLAICLLNAGQQPIRSYYTLKRLQGPINEGLSNPLLRGSFRDANEATLEAIADLFGILDNHGPTPNVGKTKLMKVLHRKRPALIPLFDENVRRCYSVLGTRPIPPDRQRTHREFARVWLPAFQADFRSQEHFWEEIAALALPEVPITPLRAMDIIAWYLGRKQRKEEPLELTS
ncbi:DUF6308 family protein [Glutamicibacter creatinolyticus]|uniref:DUF6308 family protein n=1 Tax=Glutamicibacter creatinolyticus TaxID=162496 RepID=UPI003217B568